MKDYLEIKFWSVAKWLIRKEWGADCEDYCEDCGSCRAKKVIEWVDHNIELIKGEW